MANPYGNLAGFSDPSEPGWEQRVLAAVNERQTRSGNRDQYRRQGQSRMYFDDGFRELLDLAAQRRDISIGAYCRRATGAFIAFDFDLSLEDVVKYSSRPVPYGQTGGGRGQRINDNGLGFGPWTIGELKE